MKAKILLTSMVLPALFAACTNDEIVENNGGSISGRKTFEPVSVTLAGDAQTRFEWSEGNFGWKGFTAEDKFSAGLVDAALWTVGDEVMTNFVYSSADGKNFTTPSKMMEGVYFFYSYPGFEKLSNRSKVYFDLNETQGKIDLTNPAANVNKAQFFVSPLYKIEAENADLGLPVKFTNYWATAGFKIKNTSSTDLKVVRIVLTSENEKFIVKGNIDIANMGTADEDNSKLEDFILSYDKTSGEYIYPYTDDKKTARWTDADFYLAGIATPEATTGSQSVIMVDVENGELAAGKEATAFIQVPSGLYEGIKMEVFFEVEEEAGKVVKSLSGDFVEGYTNDKGKTFVKFLKGYTTAGFGVKDGALASFEIDELKLMAASASSVKYAASYADLLKIMKETSATPLVPVDIFNIGSLAVDDQVLNMLANLSNREVRFENPINVTTEATTVKPLTNITFKKGAVVEKGTFLLDADNIVAAGTMNVKAGGKVIVKNTQAGVIENDGTVQVTADVQLEVKHGTDNAATLEFAGDINIDGNTKLTLSGVSPANVKVLGGTSTNSNIVTVSTATSWTQNVSVAKYAEIAGGNNLTVNGTVSNKGKIAGVKVDGALAADNTTILWAVINNEGEVDGAALNKYGKVKQMVESASAKNVSGVTGSVIDNSIGGFVTGKTGAVKVYAFYEGNQSGKLGNVSNCDVVSVKGGTWTNPNVATTVSGIELSGVTLTKNTTGPITMDGVTSAKLINSTVNAALTLSNATSVDLKGAVLNAEVILPAITTLNLGGVTVNAPLTAASVTTLDIDKAGAISTAKATTVINDKVTTNANALNVKDYNTLEVKADAVLSTTNTTGMVLAIATNGAVKNYGSILGTTTSPSTGWTGNKAALIAGASLTGGTTYFVAADLTITTVTTGTGDAVVIATNPVNVNITVANFTALAGSLSVSENVTLTVGAKTGTGDQFDAADAKITSIADNVDLGNGLTPAQETALDAQLKTVFDPSTATKVKFNGGTLEASFKVKTDDNNDSYVNAKWNGTKWTDFGGVRQ